MRRDDGAVRVVHVRAEVTLGPTGDPRRLDGTCSDVTERRLAERRLGEAQRLAELGLWEWHVETDEIRWSEEMYRIVGVDPEHFVPTREILETWAGPEDRERLREDIRAVVRTGAPSTPSCGSRARGRGRARSACAGPW